MTTNEIIAFSSYKTISCNSLAVPDIHLDLSDECVTIDSDLPKLLARKLIEPITKALSEGTFLLANGLHNTHLGCKVYTADIELTRDDDGEFYVEISGYVENNEGEKTTRVRHLNELKREELNKLKILINKYPDEAKGLI